MSYKNATIALTVVLVVTYAMLLVCFAVFLLPQLRMQMKMNSAVQHAADNDTMCSIVACDFVPDPAPVPPTDAELAASGSAYNITTSKFAAQAVAVLEDAVLNKRDPAPLPNTALVALISGTQKDKDRMKNMAWVLQPHQAANQLWVAFRGTQTEEEWKIDWDLTLVPLSGGVHVHKGFLDAIHELVPPLVELLAKVPPTTHVFLTGHSLGASLATLCTAILASTGVSNLHTYVFAPPRVGNDNFVKMVLGSIGKQLVEFHAVANVADIIPQVPLSVMPNVKDPSMPLLYAQFPLLMFQDNWGSWIHNHVMPVYIANLAKVSPVAVNLGSKKPTGLPSRKPAKTRVPPGFTHSLAKKILFT